MVCYFPVVNGANRLPIGNLAPLDESVKMTFVPPARMRVPRSTLNA